MAKTKTCPKCGETKPLSEFAKNKHRKDGYCCYCKECTSAIGRARYAEDPGKRRVTHLWKTYGLTLADYDEVLEVQGGGCAICGVATGDEAGRRLHVDHDHETGENRGLLCKGCNQAIGLLGDSPENCRQAMLYLRRWGKC